MPRKAAPRRSPRVSSSLGVGGDPPSDRALRRQNYRRHRLQDTAVAAAESTISGARWRQDPHGEGEPRLQVNHHEQQQQQPQPVPQRDERNQAEAAAAEARSSSSSSSVPSQQQPPPAGAGPAAAGSSSSSLRQQRRQIFQIGNCRVTVESNPSSAFSRLSPQRQVAVVAAALRPTSSSEQRQQIIQMGISRVAVESNPSSSSSSSSAPSRQRQPPSVQAVANEVVVKRGSLSHHRQIFQIGNCRVSASSAPMRRKLRAVMAAAARTSSSMSSATGNHCGRRRRRGEEGGAEGGGGVREGQGRGNGKRPRLSGSSRCLAHLAREKERQQGPRRKLGRTGDGSSDSSDSGSSSGSENSSSDDEEEKDEADKKRPDPLLAKGYPRAIRDQLRDLPKDQACFILCGGSSARNERTVQLLEEGRLCDVKVHVGDRAFSAHRIVLASASDYFYALFCEDRFEDSSAPEIELQDMDADIFETVLKWMYNGVCVIDHGKLLDLLRVSSRLQCSSLMRKAEKKVCQTMIGPDNCLYLWDLAEGMGLERLANLAQDEALDFFNDIRVSEDFKELPAHRLCSMLENDHLSLACEEEVFKSVMFWANSQPQPVNAEQLEKVMGHVRFPLMSKSFFDESVKKEPLLVNNLAVMASVLRSFKDSEHGEQAERTRLRRAYCKLEWEAMEAELQLGLYVLIKDDLESVKAICERPAPGALMAVGWQDCMKHSLGDYEFLDKKNCRLCGVLRAVNFDGRFWWPLEVFERVV